MFGETETAHSPVAIIGSDQCFKIVTHLFTSKNKNTGDPHESPVSIALPSRVYAWGAVSIMENTSEKETQDAIHIMRPHMQFSIIAMVKTCSFIAVFSFLSNYLWIWLALE